MIININKAEPVITKVSEFNHKVSSWLVSGKYMPDCGRHSLAKDFGVLNAGIDTVIEGLNEFKHELNDGKRMD